MKRVCLWIFLSCLFLSSRTDTQKYKIAEAKWVDSVFNIMSDEEKIGQLFMVAAYSNKVGKDAEKHRAEIDNLIEKYHIGGLIFFQGGPVRQANLTNRYQKLATIPLFIAMDAEWGLGMRLDSTLSYPKQMTLGALKDNTLIYQMGQQIGEHCKRLGVHINFAPVVDINSNPRNPVIGNRSFGENKEKVAAKGLAYMKGMQNKRILANGKHFPGHGDTETDSHFTLPIIHHDKKRLNEVELYPFKKLIQDSLMSMMVAHMHVPAYDSTQNKATTLSRYVVTTLLKEELGFEGLIFTDALNMKGVSSFYDPGEADVLALMAGNDVLLYSGDVPKAVKEIKTAIRKGRVRMTDIDTSVKKILRSKYWAGLNTLQPIKLYNLYEDLNKPSDKAMIENLYQQATTVVKNQNNILPIQNLQNNTFASISIGKNESNAFQDALRNYTAFENYIVGENELTQSQQEILLQETKNKKTVIVSLHQVNKNADKNYGIKPEAVAFIEKLQKQNQVIVCVFGSPYSLGLFEKMPLLVVNYEDNEFAQRAVPQIIFGALPTEAKLPVSASLALKEGTGHQTKAIQRLSYGIPEAVAMNSQTLGKIDAIALQAIVDGAMPGCQVLVARKGKVVFQKSYGYQTYQRDMPVNNQTLYDLASISKVAGTLQTVMMLYDKGDLNINKKVVSYLPELKKTNKKNLEICEVLAHQAGLVPFIPYWAKTMSKDTTLNADYYSTTYSEKYPLQVAKNLYAIRSMEDSLWKWTVKSDMLEKKGKTYEYKYSDLSFYFMKKIAEKIIKKPMDAYLDENLYASLGASNLTYNPLKKFSEKEIAPTEDDKLFRKTLLKGTVHDQGAAMLGGVGGHAGLFGNANDLAKLMQMNLQQGSYGGKKYFSPKTVAEFVQTQFENNRRGLGWDKPKASYISDYASSNSYGHTGFTGTMVWVDPNYDLVYIFLSNRVYPNANNELITKQQVRKKIQDVVYQAVICD